MRLYNEFTSSEYKIAEAKDELMWRQSVQRRIDAKKAERLNTVPMTENSIIKH